MGCDRSVLDWSRREAKRTYIRIKDLEFQHPNAFKHGPDGACFQCVGVSPYVKEDFVCGGHRLKIQRARLAAIENQLTLYSFFLWPQKRLLFFIDHQEDSRWFWAHSFWTEGGRIGAVGVRRMRFYWHFKGPR